jgi:hypothetical protein
MSKMKNKHFDDINYLMEKARFEKVLMECPATDFSPIYLVEKLYGKFYLTKEEMVNIVREFYNF